NVVLLSDGADSISTATEAQAVAALTGAHAAVFAVGIASDEFDPSRLASLVGGSGGSFSTSRDPVDLTAQFSRIRAAIENQYELLYTSTGPGGALSLDLSVGTLAAQVQTQAGSTGVAASPRPLRPAEALFFYGAGVLLIGLLAVLGAPSAPVGVAAAGLVAAVPVVAARALRTRRLKAFEAQLPDTLNLLAGSLRAGYSFLQCVEAVAQETTDPMARELRRALAEARLGRPVEEALGDIATRMESRDFEWSVMAIRIQREVGGNLAELLQTVSETMVQRARMPGEVKALTAEGRLARLRMGVLPGGL